MTKPCQLVQITPFFGVFDLERAIVFYRDVLAFTIWSPGGGYAYAERERVGLRLLMLDAAALNPPGCSHAYIDVHDVDSLFAELQPALATLPTDRWGQLRHQSYDQREFWVRDPDGNLLTFGQGVGPNADQWTYRA
jgi:catechol 2,3-dioxygenase-like lactoylglutathione lyase family enzyme